MRSSRPIIHSLSLGSLLLSTVLLTAYKEERSNSSAGAPADSVVLPLSPEESMARVRLPEGYRLELVASEPMVKQPVAIAWDGDARLYVAEMNTYMQDIKGSGTNVAVSRVSLLEDTDGDGRMDKHRVFIDSLMLPRMLLCVGNRLIVNETYTHDLWSYEDTNGDGKADKKEKVYESGKNDKRNLEHQNSGLLWNLDNRIYLSRDPVRYRYTGGKIEAETYKVNPQGQWGLANDDYGRLYFSFAGGHIPALGFQINPVYGRLDLPDQYDQDFVYVWPIIPTPDNNGSMRPDSSLDIFTASCGQSIFRGDRLPVDMKGDYFVCEPVGRLIRRAKVTNDRGKIRLKNAYDRKEFLASSDMYFRPVTTATGPDGCLYIVDMYHGIIQESQWVSEGGYIYRQIQRKGLDRHKGMGRIYRLVHDKHRRGPAPKMLGETTLQLVGHLNHPNGWWRETAQKEIIVRNDLSVVPLLKTIADGKFRMQGGTTELARLHAFWTLEGIGGVDRAMVLKMIRDRNPKLRIAALIMSERYLKLNDAGLLDRLNLMAGDPDPEVRIQLALSLGRFNTWPKAQQLLTRILRENPHNEVITQSEKGAQEVALEKERIRNLLWSMNDTEKKRVLRGSELFQQVCAPCHGGKGKGVENSFPALSGSARVKGNANNLIRILLHGLSGPIDGKAYPEIMPPMRANDDEWLASVVSYIRTDFGAKSSLVTPEMVKKVRAAEPEERLPWTVDELGRTVK